MTKAEIEALYDQIDGCLLSIAYSGDHSLVGVADALSASKSALQALTDENERLVASIDNPDVVGTLLLARATDQIAAAEARAIAAEEALVTIANGNVSRPIGKPWRGDGKPSKNDKCVHDVWMYEDCATCIEDFARAALAQKEGA